MKHHERFLALFLALMLTVTMFAGCAAEKAQEGEKITEPAAPETASEPATPETASEPADTRTVIARERETDPILTWEDPLTDEELAAWEAEYFAEPESEKSEEEYNEYHDYIRMRNYHNLAMTNYPAYYYYFSGRSEYNGDFIEGHRHDALQAMFGSYYVPHDFLSNMKTDACVKLRVKEVETVTIERQYTDEAEKDKMEAMGEEPTCEMTVVYCEMLESYWGEQVAKEFAVVPRVIELETKKDLCTVGKEFVAFVYIDDNTESFIREGMMQCGLKTDGLFELVDGKLAGYSAFVDIARFDGKTPEEMIAEGIRLAEKYPELVG